METVAPLDYTSSDVINRLRQEIEKDPAFELALTASLIAAKHSAANGKLNPDLYEALNKLYNGNAWPTSPENYLLYLEDFAKVIPSENTVPGYTAWNNNDQQDGYSQEIYDRLCHFYWLIDQSVIVKDTEITLQDYVNPISGFRFADWLVSYAKVWGCFLDTPESLTPETLKSFENDPKYHVEDSSDYISTWKSFNDFFYRHLNAEKSDGTPMRPIANPGDNTTICAPADATYKQCYPIDESGRIPNILIKQTHSFASIDELLDGSDYAEFFRGGTFAHYFLSPFDYHRFHVPVSGKVLESRSIPGNVYLNVDITNEGQFDAPDGASDGYEFTQARGIIIIDTEGSPEGNIGKIAVVPVGMAQVSSVNMDLQVGDDVKKGDEFGYFAFGGSDIILLFEKDPSLFLVRYTDKNIPIHFKYGEAAGYWNGLNGEATICPA